MDVVEGVTPSFLLAHAARDILMRGEREVTRLADLRQLWARWTEIVEMHAKRRWARRWVRGQEYHALWHGAVDCCRFLAESADEKKQAFYLGLEDILRPWTTPWALEQAEHEILFGLLERCREAEQGLGGSPRGRILRLWLGRGLLAILAAGAAALAVLTAEILWLPLLEWLSISYRVTLFTLRQWLGVETQVAIGILAVVISVYLVSRSVRA